jgi:hypothetical protein
MEVAHGGALLAVSLVVAAPDVLEVVFACDRAVKAP